MASFKQIIDKTRKGKPDVRSTQAGHISKSHSNEGIAVRITGRGNAGEFNPLLQRASAASQLIDGVLCDYIDADQVVYATVGRVRMLSGSSVTPAAAHVGQKVVTLAPGTSNVDVGKVGADADGIAGTKIVDFEGDYFIVDINLP